MPESTLDRLNTAMNLQLKGELPPAESIYLDILKTEPENPDAVHLLGLIRSEQDENDAAVELIQKAIGINPLAAPFHHNIAGIYRRMGRLTEAESEFRKAIELKADYAEAYQGLAEMVKFEKSDPLISSILLQLQNRQMEKSQRGYFHFAAGKFYDDVGSFDVAFRHYQAGNDDADKKFDNAEFRQQIKNTIYLFDRKLVKRNEGSGNPSEQPVFIVGMPRSGTTLIEQILASHSSVFGAGELNEMKFVARLSSEISRIRQGYPLSIPGITKNGYEILANDYLQRTAIHNEHGEYRRVVDKHPLNFQFVGLILQMFPNARIIHTVRHPLDTCLSCFFQNFTKGQDYSFNLQSLAHFYMDYARLMEHWDLMYPGKILNVEYEKVLSDQESETRRLLDFCGLDFEEQCLNFHETDRVVKTASFLQVRKPIYQSSRNRWKRYASYLSEVAAILGIEVEMPVTISDSLLR
jgi:tetratricopeptide (TPR) repeat protein